MSSFQRRRKNFILAFTVGLGMLLWLEAPLHAEQADLTEPTGIRETTLRYLALGSADDLMRIRDAFDKTERELARLQLDVRPEELAQFAEKQNSLEELQDRLVVSVVVFRHLDRYSEEMPAYAVDRFNAEERAFLRGEILRRINALQKTTDTLEKTIRSDQAEYLRILVDERKGLATLLAARRAQLLAEYARFPDCHAADRPCFQNELRTLCNLKSLVSEAERLPILRLIAEVGSRLNAPKEPETPICESL